ncbi:hypothetical protein ACLB2K_064297 [Fragaria x ananassa]
MECTWPASRKIQEKVKEELLRGHELANQLRVVVGNGDGGLLAKGFVKKIMCSFTTSLSLLTGNHESKGEHVQFSTGSSTFALPTIVESSSSWDVLKTIKSRETFTDSSSSSKKRVQIFRIQEFSCGNLVFSFIPRKISHSWSRDAPDFIDDGHAWRKYGQKQILNARHPRSYFRCSHKYEQGCKATKQVQKVEDDPSLFRTTYFGNHTCNHRLLKPPELILDNVIGGSPIEESNSMFTITFENNNLPCELEHPFFSSNTSIEREIIKSNHVASSQSSSLSFDYLVQRDRPMLFESSELQSEDMAMMEYFAQEILPML